MFRAALKWPGLFKQQPPIEILPGLAKMLQRDSAAMPGEKLGDEITKRERGRKEDFKLGNTSARGLLRGLVTRLQLAQAAHEQPLLSPSRRLEKWFASF